jgi:hypothetical protein
VLVQIHFDSLSPSLPIASRTLHAQLSNPPPTLAARYLLALHGPARSSRSKAVTYPIPPKDLLLRCLRHGICTLPVVHALERLFPILYPLPPLPPPALSSPSSSPPLEPTPRPPPRLYLFELPKRIFRHPNLPPPTLIPLLDHLFREYSPDVSSHKGYALCTSVLQHPRSLELTRYLLSKGADPAANDEYAVRLAVIKKDLGLVKLLIEPEEDDETKVGTVKNSNGKRRRVQDRMQVTEKLCELDDECVGLPSGDLRLD